MKSLNFAGIAAAIFLAASTVASAAPTLSFSGLNQAQIEALTPVANIAPTSTTGNYFNNVIGNQFNGGGGLIARSPWEGTSHQNTDGVFSSVQGGSSATFEFDKVQTGLSMIWGSPDSYNDLVITLLGGGGTYTINGNDVKGPSGILASLVGVTNVAFQKIVLTSGSNAFEFANLKTTPVPIPAGALLLVTAVGGLALVRRRKSA
ncbi:MAG: VPLPA-CTERM sorting domain-containing protein [Roseibium album]|uniref:VPLPA-CTERM sorting domain-containing protein n=2 Tax=cellular organisms TaxID=131567 RepID=A0AA36NGZ7_9DINO|nr:VPLPA-CTERM sorting domain-containing protein [Roseibium album]MBG6143231.1 hypothetical protein [Labrenzia sp. EL_142]MBG6158591.1 hypothetical protein [Labrenzia sp. EL_162]MBG6160375.1 hypothetical protein [Labrenzia sp. EL_195]MBG6197125.1 hypothetical protein [Labrenzia sp. EL_159]MBG6203933.1 hypothetical protein [Labrenzia sp. EL_13]MCR9060453.1 VPLPA-CTERM sorting domain-containing protein [Paracoccaceae bacterium]CAJ1369813.1 unnamed protein product [Effrenium voratum]